MKLIPIVPALLLTWHARRPRRLHHRALLHSIFWRQRRDRDVGNKRRALFRSGVTGGASIISSVQVSAPPRNGSATVGDGYAVWYRSQPGFTGADAFEFTMSGTSDGRPGTSTVRVQVTVQ